MPSFELLAGDCPPGDECQKIVRRVPGVLTVVGTAVRAETDLHELGVADHEGSPIAEYVAQRDLALAHATPLNEWMTEHPELLTA